ncbi:hypothetical protein AcW1_005676 [Taiwanofungus camphoratus]|nr:hypothetical protein AcW2_004440 [Antrodia cinnamomea]KAI0933113.1 hypothetical protein AcV7_004680 [Antrodia cinnamomea]KAI0934018.1 hypothetical protein AcV5_006003 [Antrodia cinnamomea]KAI0957210.1 hypothetical protein AcW1_005676 [Antrodia cinnamomea]
MSQYNDFSNNPYYVNGGAGGGGGYLAGGSPFGSSSGSPSGTIRARGAASHSLRPTTIKQLINATQAHSDAEWMIEETEIGQVTVVAQVISIQTQTTNSVYWLDDGTGRLEARHWVDSGNEEDSERWGGIVEGVYIRVMGSMKSFGNKKYINATHLRRIQDPTEVQFHFLEAMTVTLIFQKGPPPRPGETAQVQTGAISNGLAGSSAYTAQSSTTVSNDQFANLPLLQRNIVGFILSQPPNEEGVHVAAIARAVGGDAHSIR